MEVIYRGRRYYFNGRWRTWYEPCPVQKVTAKFIKVTSADYPDAPLYRGGEFNVNRSDIESEGKAYHSRHGEYFYLEPQDDAFLFPSRDVLETPDYATIEARQKGWDVDKPMHQWEPWQRDCWLIATLHKMPLQQVVDAWKFGGQSALDKLMMEIRSAW